MLFHLILQKEANMRMEIYLVILVLVAVVAVSAFAVYGTPNSAAGNTAAEDSNDICTSNAQESANSCTPEENCGQPGCGALENRPCGCQRVCQIR